MALILSGDTGVPASGMPTGSVIQTVNNSSPTGGVSNNTTTFIDTGLTVTITPQFSNSKILIVANVNGVYSTATSTSVNVRLVRNGSLVAMGDCVGGYGSAGDSGVASSSLNYLDSPGTTSATVYKLQFCSNNSNAVYVNGYSGNFTQSYITAMEIKQ